MPKKIMPSALFAVLFIAGLLLISGTIYIVFSEYQRAMFEQRRAASVQNLQQIYTALHTFAVKSDGIYPDSASKLVQHSELEAPVLINAAWPDRPGYIYIPGGDRLLDQHPIILVYENVPDSKRKLGIQMLFSDGIVQTVAENDFLTRLKNQQSDWERKRRIWHPEALMPKESK